MPPSDNGPLEIPGSSQASGAATAPRMEREKLEVAHVLFTDIVGYSRLPIDQQRQIVEELQAMVRSTPEFAEASAAGRLICLPTGDGMALAFLGDPMSPVQCALELAGALKKSGTIQLRMGIHSGPVYRVADINANSNVAGGGINMAQRVMDCGDAGHILVSKTVADMLKDLSDWTGRLDDLGVQEVKHGVQLQVFNLSADDLGNRSIPSKLRATQRHRTNSTRIRIGALVASILLLTGAGAGYFRLRHSPSNIKATCSAIPALSAGKYLAVLPFEAADDGSLGQVAQAVFEKLSAQFSNTAKIRVSYDTDGVSKGASIEQAACDLGANLIVQGTINGSGDSIRVHLRLHDVISGKSLLSEEFMDSKQDLFKLVNDVSTRIIRVIGVGPSTLAALTQAPTQKIDAYYLYLQGVHALRDRDDDTRIDDATKFYNRALTLDPNFALAYAGMADAHNAKFELTKVNSWASQAVHCSEQAEALDGKLPEAHIALGTAYTAVGENDEAIAHLQHALQLRPNSDDVYRRLGKAYLNAGRKNETLAAYKKAVSANFYYWNNHYQLGEAYRKYGMTKDALEEFNKVVDQNPGRAIGYEALGNIYLEQADYKNSIDQYRKALAAEPSQQSYTTYSNLGTAYFYLKRYKEASDSFERAVKMNAMDYSAHGNLADAYRWSEPAKASAEYDTAMRLALNRLSMNPRDASTLGNLAVYYAKRERYAPAFDAIKKARALDRNDMSLIYDEGLIQSLAGQGNQALTTLRQLLRMGFAPENLLNDPELDGLRKQFPAEFAKLTKK